MSNTLQAIATIETASDLYIEVVVDCNLYYESAAPEIGINSGCFEADGYELTSVNVWDEDGESVFETEDQNAMGVALAFLTLAGHDCEKLIEDACEEEISGYDPRDSECYAP
jgi:hypothetical protein